MSVVADGLSERDVLALTLDAEARSGGPMSMLAVGGVIRNRAAWGPWGRSMRAVCLAPRQFSCWNPGTDRNHVRLVDLAEEIAAGRTPEVLKTAYEIADALAGDVDDLSNGADHYYAPAGMVPPGRVPKWAVNRTPTAHIGGHLFFRLRGSR